MPTEITVHGAATVREPPERGIVHVAVSYEGPEMEPVYDRVAHDVASVKQSVETLQSGDDSAVTRLSAHTIRTWSTRPWNQDGIQLPLVHHAKVDMEVEFRDFTALSRWLAARIEDTGGLDVSHVEWALTTERREDLLKQVRTEAVKDAARRAQQYADALELGEVRPVAVADSGMLGTGSRVGGSPDVAVLGQPMRAGPAPEIGFAPEDIEVSAGVDARFVVG